MDIIKRLEDIRRSGKELPVEIKTASPDIFQLIQNHLTEADKYEVARIVHYSNLKNWNDINEFYYLNENKTIIKSISINDLIKLLDNIGE